MTHLMEILFKAFLVTSLSPLAESNLGSGVSKFKKDSGNPCSQSQEHEIEVCLRPMLGYATTLQSNGLLPLEGAQVFRKLCDLYSDFSDCGSHVTCSSVSSNAMEASYGYMCGDGFSLFSKHVHCFAEVENQEKYLKCKNEATSGVNELHFDSSRPEGYFKRLCSIMQSYLECSRPIIITRCGQDAWDLVTRVTTDSLSVTMPQCDLAAAMTEKPDHS